MTHLTANDNDRASLANEFDTWDWIYVRLREQGLAEEQIDVILDGIERTILSLDEDGLLEAEVREAIAGTNLRDFADPNLCMVIRARIVQRRRQNYQLIKN